MVQYNAEYVGGRSSGAVHCRVGGGTKQWCSNPKYSAVDGGTKQWCSRWRDESIPPTCRQLRPHALTHSRTHLHGLAGEDPSAIFLAAVQHADCKLRVIVHGARKASAAVKDKGGIVQVFVVMVLLKRKVGDV